MYDPPGYLWVITIAGMTQRGSCSQGTGSIPKRLRNQFNTP